MNENAQRWRGRHCWLDTTEEDNRFRQAVATLICVSREPNPVTFYHFNRPNASNYEIRSFVGRITYYVPVCMNKYQKINRKTAHEITRYRESNIFFVSNYR